MNKLLFERENIFQHLALVRISLGLVVLWTVGYAYFFDASFSLRPFAVDRGPILSGFEAGGLFAYQAVRWLYILSAIFVSIGLFTKTWTAIMLVGYLLLSGFLNELSGYWVQDQFMMMVMLVVLFTRSNLVWSVDGRVFKVNQASPSEAQCFGLSLLQLFPAFIYIAAILTKLRVSGFEWFLTGRTLYVELFENAASADRPIGLALLQFPEIFPAIGIMTFVFELGIPLALFLLGPHWLIGIAMMIFHLMIQLMVDTPFQGLWAFYPALYLGTPLLKYFNQRSIRAE